MLLSDDRTTNQTSPPVAQKTKRAFYKPELDAMRFLAFFLVFLHHVPGTKLGIASGAGAYGMCIFFMLSAYLIAELLMRERETTGTVHIKSFFIRRALRIWPLYFFAVALAVGAGELVAAWHIPRNALPYLLVILSNFYVSRYGWHLGLIDPLWSLAIEEQFYLAIPTVVKRGGKRALLVLSLLCFVLSYATILWLGAKHANPQTVVWVNTLVQSQYFAAGTILAIVMHGRQLKIGWLIRWPLFLGGLSGFYLAERFAPLDVLGKMSGPHLSVGYAMVLFSCVAIFLSILDMPAKPPKAIVYLGRISFGLYVYHDAVINILYDFPYPKYQWNFALQHPRLASVPCLAIIILTAITSFELFERKILRYKEKFAFIKSGAEAPAVRAAAKEPV